MVPRYARPEMTAIWEPESKYEIWFLIEAHATQKLAELGVVPESGAKALWDWWKTGPKIDVAAIDEKDEQIALLEQNLKSQQEGLLAIVQSQQEQIAQLQKMVEHQFAMN